MKKQVERYNPDFLQIPYQLMKMKPSERFIYAAIYYFTKMKGGKCFASNTELARIACISPTSVPESLEKLENEGFIKRLFKDETKKHREEIVDLIKTVKLPYTSKYMISAETEPIKSPDLSIDKHTDLQISNNNKEIYKVEEKEFSSEEYLKNMINSSKRFMSIIAIFALKKKLFNKLKTKAQVNDLIPRYIKVARRLEKYDDTQILKAIKECESLEVRGEKVNWSLELVEKQLLK